MVTVLSFSFEQYLEPFTVLLVQESSEMGLVIHLSSHVFWSSQIQKRIGYESLLFFENVQN